jgi:arginine decarboxylase
MEEFGKRFPGFEREVHGIELDPEGNYWMRGVIEKPVKGKQKASAAARKPRKKKELPHLEPEPVGAGWQR